MITQVWERYFSPSHLSAGRHSIEESGVTFILEDVSCCKTSSIFISQGRINLLKVTDKLGQRLLCNLSFGEVFSFLCID